MRYTTLTLLSILLSLQLSAQTLDLDSIVALPNQLQESSGLLFFNNKLITHTDSGGENALYEIDSNTAQVLRTIYITNAINKDWEDITQDENHIYIADFGNNAGSRTDLKILKINKTAYLSSDSVVAEFIHFSYEDQIDFTSSSQSTNFDAEGLISFKDSLYIFSKNWGNEEVNVYQIPRDSGIFTAKKIANYNVEGMITGADYNKNTESIFLIGYRKFGLPFAVSLKDFTNNNFFEGSINRYNLELKGSVQVEAISSSANNKYYVSSEEFFSLNAILHSFNLKNEIIQSLKNPINLKEMFVSPNPTNNKTCINKVFKKAQLFNSSSQFVKKINKKCFDLSSQKSGSYFLKVFFKSGETKVIKIVKN